MKIGGFQKFSLIDYPGYICSIIFTQGCNFRCPFCHNPSLVLPELFGEPIDISTIFDFIKARSGKINAVSITGGEPTIHNDLLTFIKELKSLQLKIKLDTNGSNPNMIENLLQEDLIDYIAMDIKAPLRLYNKLCGSIVNKDDICSSINIIKNSRIDYEFRTTLAPELFPKSIQMEIDSWMLSIGVKYKHRFQKFVEGTEAKPTLGQVVQI